MVSRDAKPLCFFVASDTDCALCELDVTLCARQGFSLVSF